MRELKKRTKAEIAIKSKDLKEFFLSEKKLKLIYRISLDEVKTKFRIFSTKFKLKNHDFKLFFLELISFFIGFFILYRK